MASPLVAVRELHVGFKGDRFRVELGVPRSSSGIVFLLRDNGNVSHGHALAFALRQHGFGTAICHLLTEAERARAVRYQKVPVCAELLARRLTAAVDVVGDETDSSVTGAAIAASGVAAAAALRVAALRPLAFDAMICRHAKVASLRSLPYVRAATLFLAVAGDFPRIRPMTRVFQQLQCPKRFQVVSGESTMFDDAQSFRLATELTVAWLHKHLGRVPAAAAPPFSQPENVGEKVTK